MAELWGEELPVPAADGRSAAEPQSLVLRLGELSKEADPQYKTALRWGQKLAKHRQGELMDVFPVLSSAVVNHIRASADAYAMAEYWKWKAGAILTRVAPFLLGSEEDSEEKSELSEARLAFYQARNEYASQLKAEKLACQFSANSRGWYNLAQREEKIAWELACAEQAARNNRGNQADELEAELATE